MIKMTHYLYTLSSWSFVAEDAVREVRDRFGDALDYDWRIAVTDYGGSGPFAREKLQFFYDRLERATGRKYTVGWWRPGYDWLVPDRVAVAARLLGETDSHVRLAIAHAGLVDGANITEVNTTVEIAARVSGLDARRLRAMVDDPETTIHLFENSKAFDATGVLLRPAIQLTNELGDRVVLSGIWNAAPMIAAIEALLTDERSYREFAAAHT